MVSRVDKDALLLLLWHLSPASALALRATCRHFNHLVSTSQTYWFYKFKAEKGKSTYASSEEEREIAGRKKIHTSPVNWQCVSTFGIDNAFKLLELHFPDSDKIAASFAELHQLGNNDRASRIIKGRTCAEHYHLLAKIPDFQCCYAGHLKTVYDPSITPKLYHREMQSVRGLFMYHYLFRCYHNCRKRISLLSKREEGQRQNIISGHQNQIIVMQSQIVELERQILTLRNFDQIKEDCKICPFNRKSPENYDPTLKKKPKNASTTK